jgi:hypothetical protein
MSVPTPPAGWYPDPSEPSRQRWWDGKRWGSITPADQVAPSPLSTKTVGTGAFILAVAAIVFFWIPVLGMLLAAGALTWLVVLFAKRTVSWKTISGTVLASVSLVLSIVLTANFLGSDSTEMSVAEVTAAVEPTEAASSDEPAIVEETSAPAPTPEPEPEPEPEIETMVMPDVVGMPVKEAREALKAAGFAVNADHKGDKGEVTWTDPEAGSEFEVGTMDVVWETEIPMTLAQEQAVESAQSYVDFTSFSKAGLIGQLTSEYGEGFEKKDAEFAVDNIDVDWKAEAVEAAESYLAMGGFSANELHNQLTSQYGEEFTDKQADHALEQVGY